MHNIFPGNESELKILITNTAVKGSPHAMRTAFTTLAGPQDMSGVTVIHRGGVRCLAIGSGPELIWFHGGGYVFGAPETHMNLARELATCGVKVILPDYQLAPENIWPAPLNDALAVIDASVSEHGSVAVGGDSAGGHLALCCALRRQLSALALIAPNTDRSGLSTTRRRSSDIMNDGESDSALADIVMPNVHKDAPDASPILGKLSMLPPLHLEVAGNEVLLDDSLLLARQAALAGCDIELNVTPGLFHMFPLWPQALPQGKQALQRLATFVLRFAC